MDAADQETRNDKLPSLWSVLFSWPGFFIFAWVIYEYTSQVSLSVTFCCIKFGWAYFRTAFWLRRTDPDRARGKVGFWIYFAGGLWAAAMVGFILMFVYVAVHSVNLRQAGPPPEFVEAGLVALFGFLISGVATLRALGLALWHRKKIWLNASVHQCRALNIWPPTSAGQNQASSIILTSLVLTVIPTMVVAIFLMDAKLGQMAQVVGDFLAKLLFVCMFFLPPLFLLVARDYLQRRVLARDAGECWNEAPHLLEPESQEVARL
jgi:hypothetical protein